MKKNNLFYCEKNYIPITLIVINYIVVQLYSGSIFITEDIILFFTSKSEKLLEEVAF